ncbi:MAG: ATP-binding protein, partial [Gammaproteobacteria bacterium]|nr:ATP-binding protein [Gammaproteobacteria bacterium]
IFQSETSLLSDTHKKGKVVIYNEPTHIKRKGEIPEGHPPINSYLGVPVYYGDQLIGMYGLANKPGGYSDETVKFLDPVNTTYGIIIQSERVSELQNKIKQDLLLARDSADSANHAKSLFLAKMSHELRTPLNAILGYAQLLEVNAANLSESDLENVEEITSAGKHLLDVINEILDLSSIEAGKIKLNKRKVAISAVINECLSLTDNLRQEKNISIECDCHNDFELFTDYMRFKQILLNLISNAIKYNKENGSVHIGFDKSDEQLNIRVIDTGIGIDSSAKERLFSSFERIIDDDSAIQGTGIGLYISQQLAHLLDGEITCESQLNEGSTFTLTIPLYKEHAGYQSNDSDAIDKNTRKVLYVEDNLKNLTMVKQIFDMFNNIEFYGADTPEKGLNIATEIQPDLILLDINLPNMNGYELLELIRNTPGLENTDAIGVSASSMPEDLQKAEEASLTDYIVKPINIQIFIQKISQVLQLA